jgi:hypothetical protein
MGITKKATSHRNASDPRQLTQPSTLEIQQLKLSSCPLAIKHGNGTSVTYRFYIFPAINLHSIRGYSTASFDYQRRTATPKKYLG